MERRPPRWTVGHIRRCPDLLHLDLLGAEPGPDELDERGGGFTGHSALIWLVYSGLRIWFGISGGGSAIYGALAGFLGLLLFLNPGLDRGRDGGSRGRDLAGPP